MVNALGDRAPENEIASHYLSDEETKKILTPFAFEIDKSLFGTPLAAPWKRAAALLIDLLLIAILAETPGELLALVVAVTVFRLGSKKRAQLQGKVKGKKRRAMMRFIGAFIVFVVLVDTLPSIFKSADDFSNGLDKPTNIVEAKSKELTPTQSIAFAAIVMNITKKVNDSACQTVSCWQQELSPSIAQAAKLELESKEVEGGLDGIIEFTKLNDEDKQRLKAGLLEHYNQSIKSSKNSPLTKNNNTDDSVPAEVIDEVTDDLMAIDVANVDVDNTKMASKKAEKETQFYSIMKLLKGVIDDLGLEFGWAAFYFTAFTALWKGQTPGKKIFKIKVLQLDGTPLSLSDSFGRYGGYGAGIATGLLGFLQIYWDPNRQAIHDKISATVVMDLTKGASH